MCELDFGLSTAHRSVFSPIYCEIASFGGQLALWMFHTTRRPPIYRSISTYAIQTGGHESFSGHTVFVKDTHQLTCYRCLVNDRDHKVRHPEAVVSVR
jgi:hypothetical protein